MKTLLLVDPKSKQVFMTPSMTKVYSNHEFKVYKSTFDTHHQVIIRRFDDMCALVLDYTDITQSLNFEYKLNGSY